MNKEEKDIYFRSILENCRTPLINSNDVAIVKFNQLAFKNKTLSKKHILMCISCFNKVENLRKAQQQLEGFKILQQWNIGDKVLIIPKASN